MRLDGRRRADLQSGRLEQSFDWAPGFRPRVFAWLGLPENCSGKVPGVVLVHGGGGTAFKEWVQKWTAQGFAAISIAVEGQTDENLGTVSSPIWKKHEWAGPARVGRYDDSAEPLADQWMYHAAADTILATSLFTKCRWSGFYLMGDLARHSS